MTSELGVFISGGKTGILLLHDLGGAADDLRLLAQSLARAGHTVACPQLGNHLYNQAATLPGAVAQERPTNSNSLGPNSPGLWLSEADQALSRLKSRCDSVVVIGCAYGAMLALQLARSNADTIQALVLVEPRAWLPSISGRIARGLAGTVSAGLAGSNCRNPAARGGPKERSAPVACCSAGR